MRVKIQIRYDWALDPDFEFESEFESGSKVNTEFFQLKIMFG